MIFYTKNDKERVIVANCDCGCEAELHIKRFDDTSTEYYLSLHNSLFNQEQLGIIRLIGRRLKRAWCNLIGKDYLYMDIVFSEQDFINFIETCKSIQK